MNMKILRKFAYLYWILTPAYRRAEDDGHWEGGSQKSAIGSPFKKCRVMKKTYSILFLCILFLNTVTAFADQYCVSHRNFFTPKYPKGFTHFNYANPLALKGGEIALTARQNGFDTFNPFILKGTPPEGIELLHATLMTVPLDDPTVAYPYVAESIHIASDKKSVVFNLNKNAVFHDGSPVTSKDVVFTFDLLKKHGLPHHIMALGDVARVTRLGQYQVKFTFKKPSTLLPFLIAKLPVLSKVFYLAYPFDETTLVPPLGSGPYEIDAFRVGEFIAYKRVRQWWGSALPSASGQYNFDKVIYRYFKTRDAVVAALARNVVDYNWEWGIARWLKDYNFPAVQAKKVIKIDAKKPYPHGLNAIFLNTRKPHLQDRRVRKALNLLFNFEWLNHTVFFDHYTRNKSIYMDTGFGAEGKPSAEEVALLKTYKASIYPPEAAFLEFIPPLNSKGGVMRVHFEEALALLESAGWRIQKDVLTHPVMGAFRLEFLFSSPVHEKQYQEYFSTLKRFGIEVHAQSVDPAAFMARVKNFDYDAVLYFMPSFHVPGLEQEAMWSSQSAPVSGSLNLAGVKNELVDDLIDKILQAASLPQLHVYASLLDRVLSWGYYIIPMWAPSLIHVAYWDKFSFVPVVENILYPHAWWTKSSCKNSGKNSGNS